MALAGIIINQFVLLQQETRTVRKLQCELIDELNRQDAVAIVGVDLSQVRSLDVVLMCLGHSSRGPVNSSSTVSKIWM